jgi:hypothetical protein
MLEIEFRITVTVLMQHATFQNALFTIQGKTLMVEDLQKDGRNYRDFN